MTLEEIKKLTNQRGKDFIADSFKNGKVNFVYLPENDGHWFYVLFNDNSAVSLPFANNSGGPSFFGDKEYLENHLKKRYDVHDLYLKYKLSRPLNISEFEYQIEQFNIELAGYLKGDLSVLETIKSITYKIFKIFTKDYLLHELNTLLRYYVPEVQLIFKEMGIQEVDLFTTYFLEAHSYLTHHPLYGDTASYPELLYKLLKLEIDS